MPEGAGGANQALSWFFIQLLPGNNRPIESYQRLVERAIGLVTSNLALGVMLAIFILRWFLRRMRATLLVATARPISLLGTFVVLQLAGRTLNVISLAGLAFAVGMVLDAAMSSLRSSSSGLSVVTLMTSSIAAVSRISIEVLRAARMRMPG